MRRRAMSVLATTGLAALILSGCTTGSTSPSERPTADRAGSEAPAPVVSVVNDALTDADAGQESAANSTADDESIDSADTTDAAASTDAAGSTDAAEATDAATDAADSADTLTIDAGEKLALNVEGGEFVEVRLLDADHESVPVDTGTFEPSTEADFDDAHAPDDSNATDDPDSTGTTGSDTAGSSDQALAGGTTNPTHSLVDTEGDEATTPDAASSTDDDGTSATDSDDDGTSSTEGTGTSGTEWESSVDLVTGATYTWEATTVAPDGTEHTATGTVTTPGTTAQEELTAKTVIADDQTVGVAAPIVVMFNSTIPEDARAAIEARLSVDVTDEDGDSVDVAGSWGWLYDTDGISRVHYRPQEFWPTNVNVDVNLPLEGVEYSPRWYGKEDVELSFEVGRDQRVVADAASHRMTIERDGEEIADWPTSLGSAKAPSYNGTHVVMSKHEFYTMTSEQWNYETDVNWAVRIHNNGEFIHAAPWSVGSQGSANVSHGCINLSTERAKEYFDMALYGDPVEITGSSVDLTTEHSDISDWVYSWEDWQELSALT